MDHRRVGAHVALFVLVAGCGGDGLGTGPIGEPQARPLCEDVCQRNVDCETTTFTLEECIDECLQGVVVQFRGDAVETLAGCVAGTPCDQSTEDCIDEVSILDAHRDFEEQCTAKATDCGLGAEEIAAICDVDGGMRFFRMLIPSIAEEFIACLDLACKQVPACFDAIGVDL
jgi:hypothetical protein